MWLKSISVEISLHSYRTSLTLLRGEERLNIGTLNKRNIEGAEIFSIFIILWLDGGDYDGNVQLINKVDWCGVWCKSGCVPGGNGEDV